MGKLTNNAITRGLASGLTQGRMKTNALFASGGEKKREAKRKAKMNAWAKVKVHITYPYV